MQRCQTGIVEEETSKHAAGGKSESSAILSSSGKAVDETEIDALESRPGCFCKKIILRHETAQSRWKLNVERRGAPQTFNYNTKATKRSKFFL